MMWPRRPTTCTRSSAWVNSKTGVPSTYVRFDFPPLRIVAIRTEALNFSVTMSRRTERFARKGLYLTVCRWMFLPMIPRARVSSSVRAPRTSRARGGRESASNRFCSVSRIWGFHDCRNDRDARDSVPCEEGRVRRVHPTDCEHGQRRASDDRIQDVHRQQGLFGFCRTREERSDGDVVGAGRRSRGLLAWLPIDRDADDRLRSEDRPRDSRRGIVSPDMDAVGFHPTSERRIVVHEKRDPKVTRDLPETSTRFGLLLRRVDPLVSQLHHGDASLERRRHRLQQVRHG